MATILRKATNAASIEKVSNQAAFLTFNFKGKITAVENSHRILDGSVKVGTTFKGSYTYNSKATNNDSRINCGFYGGLKSNLQVGNYQFQFNNLTVRVSKNIRDRRQEQFVDAVDIFSVHDEINDIFKVFSINLVDRTSTALDSNALLLAPPNLLLFDRVDSFYLGLDINSGQRFSAIYGNIDSIELATPSVSRSLKFLKLLQRWAS